VKPHAFAAIPSVGDPDVTFPHQATSHVNPNAHPRRFYLIIRPRKELMHTASRRRYVLAAALSLALVVGFARPSSALLDKTRFAAHLGIAYFCFHHWVLKPIQQGEFANGAPHRVSTIVKGGAALLFAVHEVKVSERIAHKSNSKILHSLDGKLVGLAASFAAVGTALKAGKFSPDDVKGLTSTTTDVSNDAAAAGQPIKDVPIPDVGKAPADDASDSDSSQ
jgi:hypothetical protein